MLTLAALWTESAEDWATVFQLNGTQWFSLLGLAFGSTVLALCMVF